MYKLDQKIIIAIVGHILFKGIIMEASFWHDKWEKNQIGFHESEANALLVKHFDSLNLKQGARIFLPLCGKTRDIAWLLDKGYQVVGAELSEIAIKQLFEEIGIEPAVSSVGELTYYHSEGIDMFVGDIFDVSAEILGPVDAIYDRAALVALPPETRVKYTEHLRVVTNTAPQLLICFQYDQRLMSGPPFSIVESEVQEHYAVSYAPKLLGTSDVEGGFKGVIPATEETWLLC